jgi:hypothetical protein
MCHGGSVLAGLCQVRLERSEHYSLAFGVVGAAAPDKHDRHRKRRVSNRGAHTVIHTLRPVHIVIECGPMPLPLVGEV